ncbi:MAG: hypothetical protein IKF90_06650 [Parasporobacterium sp.]|nr:hypothetical protein [Parasporobacterium sp.]
MNSILRNAVEGHLPGYKLEKTKTIVIDAEDIQFGEREEACEEGYFHAC